MQRRELVAKPNRPYIKRVRRGSVGRDDLTGNLPMHEH